MPTLRRHTDAPSIATHIIVYSHQRDLGLDCAFGKTELTCSSKTQVNELKNKLV